MLSHKGFTFKDRFIGLQIIIFRINLLDAGSFHRYRGPPPSRREAREKEAHGFVEKSSEGGWWGNNPTRRRLWK